jgi:PKD repeat protein
VNVAVVFDGSASSDPDGEVVRYDWDFGDGNTAIDAGPNPINTYAATGIWIVELTVTDNDGSTAKSATQAIMGDGVNVPPVADAGGPYSGDEGVAVSFDGSGTSDPDGMIVSYDWDFGDGNMAIDGGPMPSHTYSTEGDYQVLLTVTDDGGKSDTDSTTASIGMGNQPPVADAGGPYPGAVGVPVQLDGTNSSDADGAIASAQWDFGDGASGSGLFPTHTYAAPGPYTATLIVTDDDGETDDSTAMVVIGDGLSLPPTADADGPYAGGAGAPVTFDGTASDDRDGNITDHAWQFGDGNIGTGPMPDNTYSAGGLYNVILQVTDDDDLIASDGTLALIGDSSLPPTADANGPYNGRVDAAVSFDGSGSSDEDGDIERYDWDFGDGNSAADAGPTPAHTYVATGKYVVRLTVTDDSGETDTDVTLSRVGIGNVPPRADAGGSYAGTVYAPLTFDGTGSRDLDGSIVTYEWQFGDGNRATGATPTHTYMTAGSYIVTLTVTDDDGAPDSRATLAVIGPVGECVVLCHKPGTRAQKTKCLPESAVGGHLGHGDTLGACDDRLGQPRGRGRGKQHRAKSR